MPLQPASTPLWQSLLFPALAGGMAWGIRGQYGHETGAMLAGLLVGLVLALLYCPAAPSLFTLRAVAWCTAAMGIGGSETYGQTIGLTQNAPVIGHWDALLWGMLGLAIKGGLWIGFAGAFLGMGLSGVRYRCWELLLVLLAMVGLSLLGVWLINQPYDPANKVLPAVYFSADWVWEPDAEALKPRREAWGGMVLALAGLLVWAGGVRRDGLAWRMGLWGLLGGALGFPGGQSLQAFHAWNPELFRTGVWIWLDPIMNWWNCMETTFGLIMGATLGLGLWLHQRRVALPTEVPAPTLSPVFEAALVITHVTLLACAEFTSLAFPSRLYEMGLVLALIPIVGSAGGRWWPSLLILPITAFPIAGKTVRQLVYKDPSVAPLPGWLIYFVLPVALTTLAAVWLARRPKDAPAAPGLRLTLLLTTWLYFGLNFGFFHFPWPWQTWTGRTPNAMVYVGCAVGLTLCALLSGRRRIKTEEFQHGGHGD